MSEFADVRREFNRQAAINGWSRPSEVSGSWPQPVDKWLKRFYKSNRFDLARQRRLINHFLVGSDPEFAMLDSVGEQYAASHLNLKAGIAFGADSNGRLVEVRPKPSRFVLEAVASLWSTLRWLSWTHPDSIQLSWRPGAFVAQDGLGGHIHFGRKRPQRPAEIAALNTLCFYMFQGNVWDRTEGFNRVRHAQGGGSSGYGRLSDVREQPYGYEYRTMPSWLCSPWMSYFSMVLAKLAVFQPALLAPMTPEMENLTADVCRQRLVALLAFYKGLDDDAQLAYEIYQRIGFPRWSVADLKPAWGIFGGSTIRMPAVKLEVWPVCIPPSQADITEILAAMRANRPPNSTNQEMVWAPSTLPEGYRQLIHDATTTHAAGLGEIAVGLCCHKEAFFKLVANSQTQLPKAIWERVNFSEILKRYPKIRVAWGPAGDKTFMIGTRELRTENRSETMAFLTDGAFPVWEIDKVQAGSYDRWHAQAVKRVRKKNDFSRSIDLIPKGAA